MSPLPVHRQRAPVAEPLVAGNLNLSLDVLGLLPAKVTFDLVVALDESPQPHDLVFGKVTHPLVGVDHGGLHNAACSGAAHAEDVGETDFKPLVTGQVYACDTCHWLLTLPLLVAGIGADNSDPPMTADDLAFFAHSLDARSDFHYSPVPEQPHDPASGQIVG
jgi:hypothetical protein